MSRTDRSSLEKIVWEIRHVALQHGDTLTIDQAVLGLADILDRRSDFTQAERQTLMEAAALLWRAGFNLSQHQQTGTKPTD
ncbi:MAG TPA: hypothetical protein VFE79_16830 [Paraburkholderia sp.]|nr:hypothetical protein [Paraburkholderia sp.]